MTPSVLPLQFAPPSPAAPTNPAAANSETGSPAEPGEAASFATLVEARRRRPELEIESDGSEGGGLGGPVPMDMTPQPVEPPSGTTAAAPGSTPSGTDAEPNPPAPMHDSQSVRLPAASLGLPAPLGWLPLIARGIEAAVMEPAAPNPQELVAESPQRTTESVVAGLEMRALAAGLRNAPALRTAPVAPQPNDMLGSGQARETPASVLEEAARGGDLAPASWGVTFEAATAVTARASAPIRPEPEVISTLDTMSPEASISVSPRQTTPLRLWTTAFASNPETTASAESVRPEASLANPRAAVVVGDAASASSPEAGATRLGEPSALESLAASSASVTPHSGKTTQGVAADLERAAALGSPMPGIEAGDEIVSQPLPAAGSGTPAASEGAAGTADEPAVGAALARARAVREMVSSVIGHAGGELGQTLLAAPGASGLTGASSPAAPSSAGGSPSMLDASALAATQELIAHGLARLVQVGRNTAEIHLEPPELGKIRLRLEVRDRTVTGSIEVERAGVFNALQADMHSLVGALEKAGIQCDRLDIQLLDPRRGQERRDPSRPGHEERNELDGESDAAATTAAPQPRAGHGLVDYWL